MMTPLGFKYMANQTKSSFLLIWIIQKETPGIYLFLYQFCGTLPGSVNIVFSKDHTIKNADIVNNKT